jgi:hypothetical protein
MAMALCPTSCYFEIRSVDRVQIGLKLFLSLLTTFFAKNVLSSPLVEVEAVFMVFTYYDNIYI